MLIIYRKKICVLCILFVFVTLQPIISAGFENPFKKLFKSKEKIITAMQDKYNDMSDTLPAVYILATSATSAVPQEIVSLFDYELPRQLVIQGALKPISMDKWLASSYAQNKAADPLILLKALSEERYLVPLKYICKPYLFKSGSVLAVNINFYPLTDDKYPIQIMRVIKKEKDVVPVIQAILQEFSERVQTPKSGRKKKVIVNDFALEFRKLIELKSGEFEYVTTPFIQFKDTVLRTGDNYFSFLFGYTLNTTNLADVLCSQDFSGLAQTAVKKTPLADYIVNGRVQLTEQICIFYIDVYDAQTAQLRNSIKFPVETLDFNSVWAAFRKIVRLFADDLFGAGTYGLVLPLRAKENAFYYNNQLVGIGELTDFILPKGRHIVYTGGMLSQEKSSYGAGSEFISGVKYNFAIDIERAGRHKVYLYFGEHDFLYIDEYGSYVWNLLDK